MPFFADYYAGRGSVGFLGYRGVAADIAKALFVIFLALFCVALLFGYAVI